MGYILFLKLINCEVLKKVKTYFEKSALKLIETRHDGQRTSKHFHVYHHYV